jgi:hypothetical protein
MEWLASRPVIIVVGASIIVLIVGLFAVIILSLTSQSDNPEPLVSNLTVIPITDAGRGPADSEGTVGQLEIVRFETATPPYDPTIYAQRQELRVQIVTSLGPPEYEEFLATETAIVARFAAIATQTALRAVQRTATAVASAQPTEDPTRPPIPAYHITATALASIVPTATSTPGPGSCEYAPATFPLLELSEGLQTALEATGIEKIAAQASVIGENCINEDGSVWLFEETQTDFTVTVRVDDLEDEEVLGELAAAVLYVLVDYPPEETPGPEPGLLTLTFTTQKAQKLIAVGYLEAVAALWEGLEGAELLAALEDTE